MTGGGDMVPGLGPLESAIMTAVWDAAQPLIVGAARERLDYRASSGGVPAYTTVMTVMNICGARRCCHGPRTWEKGTRGRGGTRPASPAKSTSQPLSGQPLNARLTLPR